MFGVSLNFLSSTHTQSPIPAKLQDALSCFTGEFYRQLNVRFQTLHQRSVQKDLIAAQHPVWAESLIALNEKMTRVWDEARACYDQIPDIESPDDKRFALARMLHLETVAAQMQSRCQKLILLLNSPEHMQALKFYKEKLKQCEVFCTEEVEDDALLAILAEVKEMRQGLGGLDVDVTEEIALLYDEICKFLLYTVQKLGKDQLVDRITPEMNHHVLQEPQSRLLSHTRNVTLPAENYFRNGQWLAGWKFIGYPDIREEFTALQEIAKELYYIEGMVQECLERACSSDENFQMELRTHEERVSDFEALINEQLVRLTTKKLSNQVHAGWYYVSSLVAQAKSVRSAISLAGNGEFRTYAGAVHKLRCYIEGRQDFGFPMASWDLYCAVVAWQKMPDLSLGKNPRVYTIVTNTLKKEAQTGCVFTGFEKEIVPQVFAHTLQFHHHLPDIQSFLIKGFLQVLYFSEEPCNPELEAVLFRFERDPLYKDEFAKCMQKQELQQLYELYKEKSGVEKRRGVIQRMTKALASLYNAEQFETRDVRITQFDRFVRFHKAHQLLLHFQKQAGAHPLTRWFNTQVMQFADKWQDALALSLPIQEELLYKNLQGSLFCSDEQLREVADAAIVQIISAKDFTMEKGAHILKVLLSRWALERFLQHSNGIDILEGLKNLILDDKPSVEMQFVTRLFMAYVQQPSWTALWRSQYGLGFMELALHKFSKKIHCLTSAREQELDLLENVLSYYAKFRKIVNEQGSVIRDTRSYDECLGFYNKVRSLVPKEPSEVINIQIAQELCAEMDAFLYKNRVGFI